MIVQFVVAALVANLWQAALIALVVTVILRLRPGANATTRYAVWTVALFASVVVPLLTAYVSVIPPSTAVMQPVTQHTSAAHVPARTAAGPLTVPARNASIPQTSAPALRLPFHVDRLRAALPPLVVFAFAGLWLLGTVVIGARLIVSLVHLEHLKRDSVPVSTEYRTHLRRWSTAARGTRDVRLCVSDEIAVPIAVGIFDAMILLPQHVIDELSTDDVDRIVLHELAHLRRADDWIAVAERIVQAIFFFSPGLIWIAHQLDLEREVACDDAVLAQSAEVVPYASCLAKMIEITAWPHRAAAAPGVFVTRRSMSIRIERLLAAHRDVGLRLSFGPTLGAFAAVAALAVIGVAVSPAIGYRAEAQTIAPVSHAQTIAVRAPVRHVTHPVAIHAPASAPSPAPHATTKVAESVTTVAHLEHNGTPVDARSTASLRHGTEHAPTPEQLHAPVVVASVVANAVDMGINDGLHQIRMSPQSVAFNDTDYIGQLEQLGYRNLSVDDLVALRSEGVSAEYIRGLQAAGIAHPSVHDLLALRSEGVTPDYIHDMFNAGFSNLGAEKLIALRSMGVSGDYVRGLRQAGYKNLSSDDVVALRSMGVSTDYVHSLADAGYANISVHQLLALRSMGVDAAFIKTVESHGFHHLSVDDLIKLKSAGVL